MHLESLLDLYTKGLNICRTDYEEGSKEIELVKKNFNEKYKIVPKEQWCVGITTSGSCNHEVGIQGPFNTEMEAQIFADIWNRKREEFIEKTLEENPNNEDLEFPYLKARNYKLEISDKNNLILKEMIQIIEDGINKIQREGIK